MTSPVVLIDYDADGRTVHVEFEGTDVPMWVGDTTTVHWEGVDTIEGKVEALSVGGGHTRVTIRTTKSRYDD